MYNKLLLRIISLKALLLDGIINDRTRKASISQNVFLNPKLLNVSFCIYGEFMWKSCGTSPVSSVCGTFSWWHFSTMLCDICINNWCIAPLKVRDNGRKGQGNIRLLENSASSGSPATVTRNVSIYERPRLRDSFRQVDRQGWAVVLSFCCCEKHSSVKTVMM